jgi:hypothetical protein
VFFNLILATRGNGNGLCGEGDEKDSAGRGDDRTWNGSRVWELAGEWALRGGGMGMTEHGMAAYPLPP